MRRNLFILRLMPNIYLIGNPSNLFIFIQQETGGFEVLSLKEKRRIQNSLIG